MPGAALPPAAQREDARCGQSHDADVIVVGGGPAGLSAALLLGRANRSVLVFDSGEKRNEASLVQHAILGADGFNRREFLDGARRQVLAYPTVRLRRLTVCDIDTAAARTECVGREAVGGGGCHSVLRDGHRITKTHHFTVFTEDGHKVRQPGQAAPWALCNPPSSLPKRTARRLPCLLASPKKPQWTSKKVILATGVRAMMPAVEGFDTYWGRGIWVCLYCDAYEYNGQALGAYGNGQRGVHLALEMLLWSRDVTLFTDGETLEATELERTLLKRHGIAVVEAPVARAVGDDDCHLSGLAMQDGGFVPLRALFFNTGRVQSSTLPEKMGLPADARGDIVCESKGNVRAIDGLYVAGNCATAPLKLVQTAASQGAVVGAKVNSELMYEELGLDADEGAAYICSLDGRGGSATECGRAHGGRRHTAHPTAGGPWEDARDQRLGTAGAQ